MHSLERMNKIMHFAAATGMIVASTLFKHKAEHKIMWIIPGETIRNQINHRYRHKKNRSSLKDVRNYRGADA